MKIRKFFTNKLSLITAVVIFLIAITLRLVAATKMAWRPDEIVYVDWIGQWFAGHFWEYLFQFFHHAYPPRSDVFGNPPFAMWILSFGIFLAQKFHFSILLGVRTINVLIGSATAVFLFYFGRKWFNFWVGFWAAISFALIPVVVTNNATAYLDTILAFLVLISLELTFRYIEKPRAKTLYVLGIILGLCILTKLVAIPVVIGLWLIIYLYKRKTPNRLFNGNYTIYIIATVLTPVILWAGLRDPKHIVGLFRVYSTGLYNPYPLSFHSSIFTYYYLMIIGILPPIIFIGFAYKAASLIKGLIKGYWKKHWRAITILCLVVGYITYNSVFARYTTSHQLLSIMPLILVLSSLGIVKLVELIKWKWLQIFSTIIILASLALPLIAFSPHYWGLYSSLLVGGSNHGYKVYSAGSGGEEVPEVSNFLRENTPEGSIIAVVAYDWIFPKYLQNRVFVPLFLYDGLGGALAKGAEYVVVPRTFFESESITARDFKKLAPIYTFSREGIELSRVYKIDYSSIKDPRTIPLGSIDNWEVKASVKDPWLNIENDELIMDYHFRKIKDDILQKEDRYLINLKEKIKPAQDGFYIEIFGDKKPKTITIIFSDDKNSLLEHSIAVDWDGWKQVYIPMSNFIYLPAKGTASQPDLAEDFSLSIGVTTSEQIDGQLKFRQMKFANYENITSRFR